MTRTHLFGFASSALTMLAVACACASSPASPAASIPTLQPPTPTVPAGYILVESRFVLLRLAVPQGWTAHAANHEDMQLGEVIVEYLPEDRDSVDLVRIAIMGGQLGTTPPSSALSEILSSPDLVESPGFEQLDTYSDLTIGGFPAAAAAALVPSDSGIAYFTILAVAGDPTGPAYLLQWSGAASDEGRVRDRFSAMTPTIEFMRP